MAIKDKITGVGFEYLNAQNDVWISMHSQVFMEMPEIQILPVYSQKMGNLDPFYPPGGLVPLAVSFLLVLFWLKRGSSECTGIYPAGFRIWERKISVDWMLRKLYA